MIHPREGGEFQKAETGHRPLESWRTGVHFASKREFVEFVEFSGSLLSVCVQGLSAPLFPSGCFLIAF